MEKLTVACVCPVCGGHHTADIERGHIESPAAWKVEGRCVVLCKKCRYPLDKLGLVGVQ